MSTIELISKIASDHSDMKVPLDSPSGEVDSKCNDSNDCSWRRLTKSEIEYFLKEKIESGELKPALYDFLHAYVAVEVFYQTANSPVEFAFTWFDRAETIYGVTLSVH